MLPGLLIFTAFQAVSPVPPELATVTAVPDVPPVALFTMLVVVGGGVGITRRLIAEVRKSGGIYSTIHSSKARWRKRKDLYCALTAIGPVGRVVTPAPPTTDVTPAPY